MTTGHARYIAPYDWPSMLAFFRGRAIEGLEQVGDDVYRRTVVVFGEAGTVEVRDEPAARRLSVTTTLPPAAMEQVMACVERAFDTGTNPSDVRRHLSRDTALAPLVALRPGLRVPGSWTPFELAVRAVLGQQITVAAARTLAGRLVALCASRAASDGYPSHGFPSPQQVLAADLDAIGMPDARRTALRRVAQAAIADPHVFDAAGSLDETVSRLRRIGGIGEWTAQYICHARLTTSRCLSGDGRRAASRRRRRDGAATHGARSAAARESWRPWRAYAAQHLWSIESTLGAKTSHTGSPHD